MKIGKREYTITNLEHNGPTRPWPLCDTIGLLGKVRQNLGETPDDLGGRQTTYRHNGLLDEINAIYGQRFLRLEQARAFMVERVAEARSMALKRGAQVRAELAAEKASR